MTTGSEGWGALPLSKVLQKLNNGRLLQQGWSPRCLTHPSGDEQTWAVVKTTAIQAGWFDETQNKELPEGLVAKPGIEILAGDLLLTCAGPRSRCGVPALVRHTRPRLMMSGKMYRFRPLPFLDARFLEMWLLSPEAQRRIDKMKTGISDSGLNLTQDRFLELPVPIPSIQEQRRIVEFLEDQFSRLEAADGELRRQMARIESLRASAIRRATSAHGVEAVPLRQLLIHSIGGLWGGPGGSDELDVQVVRVTELRRHGELDTSTAATRSVTRKQFEGRALQPGDLLLEKSGGGPKTPVGRVGLVREVDQPSICANFMQLMRPDKDRVDPRYLHLALNAFHQSGGTAPMQTASTNIRNIKASEYLQVPFRVPGLEEQRAAVADLEPLVEACTRMENVLSVARQRGNALRAALLAASVQGKLSHRHADRVATRDLVDA